MKFRKSLFLLIVCIACVQAFAQSGVEKITLSFTNVTLKDAMKRIESASDYTFAYDVTAIDVDQKVSLDAKNEEIRLAIRTMLAPTDLKFKFSKKVIELSHNDVQVGKKGAVVSVSGVVTDDSGEPVIGATVTVKGTVNGVLTNIDGHYTIQAHIGEQLEFRYIGYNSVEHKIKNNSPVNIVMTESNVNMDEVVVVGYGSQKKESVSSSVNTVRPSEFALPARSLSNMIGGQVAGIIAIQRSGEPGADDADFWIRGKSSYAGGNSALVLVDGVPRSMNDLDVDEIETFTVLKDDAATAV